MIGCFARRATQGLVAGQPAERVSISRLDVKCLQLEAKLTVSELHCKISYGPGTDWLAAAAAVAAYFV